MRLLERLRAAGVALRLEGEELVYRAPGGAIPPDLLAELRANRALLVELLGRGSTGAARPAPVPAPARAGRELSTGQRGLWFVEHLPGRRSSYNVPMAFRLRGALACEALEQAFLEIVRRHEVLRTSYAPNAGVPEARPAPAVREAFPVVDLTGLGTGERSVVLAGILAEMAREPFDLERGPVFRWRRVAVAHDEHAVSLTVHHIAFDGTSLDVLGHELEVAFAAFASGAPAALPRLMLQYADYAEWQRLRDQGAGLDGMRAYWRAKLDRLPALVWPPPGPADSDATAHQASQLSEVLQPPVLERIQTLGRQTGATFFVIACALLQALLHGRSGQVDFALGTDLSERRFAGAEQLIGLLTHQIVLRADLSGDPTLRALLERVRKTVAEAFSNGGLGYDAVVSAARASGQTQGPLFRVKLVVQPDSALPSLPGVVVEPIPVDVGIAKFDLLFNVYRRGPARVCSLEFDQSCLPGPAAAELLLDYVSLLRLGPELADRPIGDLLAAVDAEARVRREAARSAVRELRAGKTGDARHGPAGSEGGRESWMAT